MNRKMLLALQSKRVRVSTPVCVLALCITNCDVFFDTQNTTQKKDFLVAGCEEHSLTNRVYLRTPMIEFFYLTHQS